MKLEDLTKHYPVLYHMAARDSWESIRRHGLFSTSSLLDVYGIRGDARVALEEKHRPKTIVIDHKSYGSASIRDQKPMSDAGLVRALTDGLTPRDWYRILNEKVFFWTSKKRLHTLLCARSYADQEHDVLIVDAGPLVRAHAARILLCPMNSGATTPFAHPRGKGTFLPIDTYLWEVWKKKRGVADAVVEVAVTGGVPNIADYVSRVQRMRQTKELGPIYERPEGDAQ